jgi:hypothetical protein
MHYRAGDMVEFIRGKHREQLPPMLGVIVEIYPDKLHLRVFWFSQAYIGTCFRGDISMVAPVHRDEEKN